MADTTTAPTTPPPPAPVTKTEALAALDSLRDALIAHPGPKPNWEQWVAWGQKVADYIDPSNQNRSK